MEETDAPRLFQLGLPSISPYCTRKRFDRVITAAAARGVCTVEIQRLGAIKGALCACGSDRRPGDAVGAEVASRWRVMMISIEVPVST